MTTQHDVTTVLAARAMTDAGFTRRVIEAKDLERHRAVVGGQGVDWRRLAPLVAEARRQHTITYLTGLGTLVVLAFVVGPLSIVLAALAMAARGVFVKRSIVPALPERLAEIETDDEGDDTEHVIVYSGFRPFVGAGYVQQTWTFMIDASLPADDDPVDPFTIEETTEALHTGLERLHLPEQTGIVDLRDRRPTPTRRRFFIHGEEVGGPMLPDDPATQPPRTQLTPEILGDLEAADSPARDYLAIEIPRWSDDLVSSIFVRVSEALEDLGDEDDDEWEPERMIFVEVSEYALPSVSTDDQAPERFIAGLRGRDYWRELVDGVKGLYRMFGHLGWEVGLPVRRALTTARVRSGMQRNIAIDRGAELSIREMATGTKYRRYFQLSDHDRDVKLVRNRIYTVLREFLREHGVDVSALEQQARTIENNQLIVTGDNATIGDVGIGSRSGNQSRTARATQRVSKAVGS